ncbi:MAG TPA: tetratricopeptide repeat protein [Terriglobales bacterium]
MNMPLASFSGSSIKRVLFFLLPGLVFLASCSSVDSQFKKARSIEDQGNWNEAMVRYERIVPMVNEKDRHFLASLHARVGYCLLKLERPAQALSVLQKALEYDGSNIEAHLYLLELYSAAGVQEKTGPEITYLVQHAPTNGQVLTAIGAVYAAEGNDVAAEDMLLQAFHGGPQRETAAEALAEIYARDQEMEKAREILHQAAGSPAHNSTPLLYLARLEEEQGNNDAAEQAYRQAMAAQNNIETNLRLAQYLQRVSKLEEARAILRKVDGMRPEAPFSAADMDLATGHWINALGGYQTAFGSLIDRNTGRSSHAAAWQSAVGARMVEADLQVLMRKTGSRDSAHVALNVAQGHLAQFRSSLDPVTLAVLESEIALAEGDLVRARKQAEIGLQYEENAPPAHYVLGEVDYEQGRVADAMEEWQSAVDQNSRYYPARLALAQAELQQADASKAEEYVIDVVRDEPANLDALVLYARILLAQHRYDSASFLALRAAAADSSSAEPHVVLGELALAQRHIPEALLEYEKAVLIDPQSASAIQGLTAVYRHGNVTRAMLKHMEESANNPPASAALMELAGRLYADHGWYEDAKRCFQRELELGGTQSTSVHALTNTYFAEGGAQGSAAANTAEIQAYEAAVHKGDPTGVAANNLAWIYAQQGAKLDRALTLAQQAFQVAPRDPAVLDTLGFVLLKRREYSQAVQVLKKASEMLARTPAADKELSTAIGQHLKEACLRSGQPELVAQASNEDGSRAVFARERRKGD